MSSVPASTRHDCRHAWERGHAGTGVPNGWAGGGGGGRTLSLQVLVLHVAAHDVVIAPEQLVHHRQRCRAAAAGRRRRRAPAPPRPRVAALPPAASAACAAAAPSAVGRVQRMGLPREHAWCPAAHPRRGAGACRPRPSISSPYHGHGGPPPMIHRRCSASSSIALCARIDSPEAVLRIGPAECRVGDGSASDGSE